VFKSNFLLYLILSIHRLTKKGSFTAEKFNLSSAGAMKSQSLRLIFNAFKLPSVIPVAKIASYCNIAIMLFQKGVAKR